MPVSVEWIVARPGLGLRLVAGDGDRQVDWAHPIELGDPRPWLSGGELVLTTGVQLPRARRAQEEYVGRLVAAGAAGLGFGIGVRHAAVPPGIRQACADSGLPLIEVPLRTPFVAVAQAIAGRVAADREADIRHVVEIQRRMTRATQRHGVAGVASTLAAELGDGVAVLDNHGFPLAAQGIDAPALDALREVLRDPRARASDVVTLGEEARPIEVHALPGRTARQGWLALYVSTQPTASQRLLVGHAVSLAAVDLDVPVDVVAVREELGEALLRLLLAPAPSGEVTSALRHFGFAADDLLALLWVLPASGDLRKRIGVQLTAAHLPHLLLRDDSELLVLVHAEDEERTREAIAGQVRSRAGQPTVGIGVAPITSPEHLARVARSARRAARSARAQGGPVAWARETALEAVLADESLRRRVDQAVGPLLAPLRAIPSSRFDPVGTLAAYLEHNGNAEATARSLGIHRHTLTARVDRIGDLLGVDLDVATTRAALLLALGAAGS